MIGYAELVGRLSQDTASIFPAGDWYDMRPHLPVLYTLARWATCPPHGQPIPLRPAVIVEIGARQGVSTVALCAGAADSGGIVHSVDIDPIETAVAGQIIVSLGLAPFWQLHLADSNTWEGCPDGIDLLWIDGDHHHPQPTRDFERYAPKVRSGGIVAFHDACMQPFRPTENGALRCIEEVIRPAAAMWDVVVLPWAFGLAICRKRY